MDHDFGALLRDFRTTANLTQEDLARRSGLSVHAISMLERGVRRAPRSSTIDFLAAALALDPSQRAMLVTAARQGTVPAPAGLRRPHTGIPPDPVANFVGREAELADLRRLLARSGRVAVHGLGGVGKTQLVVRYLHQRRADYPDGTFWIRADRHSSLVGDLAGLGARMGPPGRTQPDQQRQVDAVLAWLRGNPRWLLVFDNVASATADWLPSGLPGHVLVTSQTPMWPVRLAVGVLPRDVARRFLLDGTGQDDAAAADAVAELLGCLPLALAQAAAYLVRTGRDLAGYAQLLRSRLVELIGEGAPDDYPVPVASTLRLSYDRMAREHPAAAMLLRLCAFLAPEDIPVGLLRTGAAEATRRLRDALADDLEFDRTVTALRRYSLVERRADELRVHRLTQAVVRESLRAGRHDAYLASAIRVLRAGFPDEPGEHPDQWPQCARLLPHVLAVEQLAADGTPEPVALAWLLDRAGRYLRARGQFAQARPLLERALRLRRHGLGGDHPDTAASLNNLGLLLGQQGELTAAGALLEQALEIRERQLGPDDLATAESLNNLASLRREQGDVAAALPLYERALAVRERAGGTDTMRVANTLNNLANLLRDRGDLAAARPLAQRALAICERLAGPDHPYTAYTLSNLGWLLHKEGDPAAARPLLERALDIRNRLLGADHPQTARTVQRLAMVVRDEDGPEAARRLLESAAAPAGRRPGDAPSSRKLNR
jgi:tetratricopeptide (TPR) repeat protein/transcriptional regulator with XRE-family HTH domain